MGSTIDRRGFIKTTAGLGASMAFLPDALADQEKEPEKSPGKSRVVQVHGKGVAGSNNRLDKDHVRKMVDGGMLRLTQEKDLASAWKHFVKPDDVVGIKLNSGGGRLISSKKSILMAVIDGVRAAGVPESRIIVWDQVEEMFHRGYVRRQNIKPVEGGVRYKGCTPSLQKANYMEGKPLSGYETEPVKFSWGQVKVAELVANELTAIINIPVLKDHSCAGVTLALKNISHAIVDVPWLCHENCCDPYIADIVDIPIVRSKLRLHILDGLFGVADGAPPLKSMDCLFTNEKMLFSTDPVAVDTIGCGWIKDARKRMGFPPLEEAENSIGPSKGRPAKHIATAAKRGLGMNDLKKIDLVKVAIPATPAEEEDDAS